MLQRLKAFKKIADGLATCKEDLILDVIKTVCKTVVEDNYGVSVSNQKSYIISGPFLEWLKDDENDYEPSKDIRSRVEAAEASSSSSAAAAGDGGKTPAAKIDLEQEKKDLQEQKKELDDLHAKYTTAKETRMSEAKRLNAEEAEVSMCVCCVCVSDFN